MRHVAVLAVLAAVGAFSLAPAASAAPHSVTACTGGTYDAFVYASPDRSAADWETLPTCTQNLLQTRSRCRNAQVQTIYVLSGKTKALETTVKAVCTSTYPQIIAAAVRACDSSGSCTAWNTWWQLRPGRPR